MHGRRSRALHANDCRVGPLGGCCKAGNFPDAQTSKRLQARGVMGDRAADFLRPRQDAGRPWWASNGWKSNEETDLAIPAIYFRNSAEGRFLEGSRRQRVRISPLCSNRIKGLLSSCLAWLPVFAGPSQASRSLFAHPRKTPVSFFLSSHSIFRCNTALA